MDIDELEALFANVEIIKRSIEEHILVIKETVTSFKKQWLIYKVNTLIMKT